MRHRTNKRHGTALAKIACGMALAEIASGTGIFSSGKIANPASHLSHISALTSTVKLCLANRLHLHGVLETRRLQRGAQIAARVPHT